MQSNNNVENDNNENEVVDLTQPAIVDKTETTKSSEKPENCSIVIAISDAEEETIQNVAQQAGKSKKRLSNAMDGATDDLFNSIPLGDIKRRKIKVAGAPKMPLNGYVRYMNVRRESLRKEHPDKSAIEHTRIIGEEWHQLPSERKAPYMEAAELDRQRYNTELTEFLKAHPDVLASELAKIKSAKNAQMENLAALNVQKEKTPMNGKQKSTTAAASVTASKAEETTANIVPATTTTNEHTNNIELVKPASPINTFSLQNHNNDSNYNNTLNNNSNLNNINFMQGEIPIFTNEFLEHNKAFDMELRTLRKTKTDLEQQNAVLEKHVDNMKSGVKKLFDENSELQERNRLLQLYLDKMRQKLVKALAGLAIPSETNGASLENIDTYMADLAIMTTTNTHGPASLNKAKDVLRKLDLQIQL